MLRCDVMAVSFILFRSGRSNSLDFNSIIDFILHCERFKEETKRRVADE